MNLEWVILSGVDQKEKKQILYIKAYLWNLEKKWYWWTYFQGRYRDPDTETSLVDTVGEGQKEWMDKVA